MAYCLYLRKSRADLDAEAHGEGETLLRHEKALLELAKRENLNITQIYREIVSGETIAARPVMRRLLAEVEQSLWEGVLVMEVERLARGDTIDQGVVAQTFGLTGTKIITPLKIYDPTNEFDEEYFEFGLFMSRREYKTINRRLQRGRIAAVKEGKYVGSLPPYGYVRKKLANGGGYTLEPEPSQARAVKLIFDLYAHGERGADGTMRIIGIKEIAQRLNSLRIPASRGGEWVSSSLQSMLRNPVYIGKIRWNGRPGKKRLVNGHLIKERPRTKPEEWLLTDGLHEPLIDDETWQLTQRRLAGHPAVPCPGHRTIKNPLSGLMICGICGRKMVRRPNGKTGCSDMLMCPFSCGNISVPLKCAEEHVIEALRKWLRDYYHTVGIREAHALDCQAAMQKRMLHDFQNELSALQKQKKNICSLLEQGIYDSGLFQERFSYISREIHSLEESITVLKKNVSIEEKNGKSGNETEPVVEHVLAEYEKASEKEKNELLKEVLDKVVYTKRENARQSGKSDAFELILYPKLPKNT